MNTQAEAAVSVSDVIKQAFSVVFVVIAIGSFYFFSDIQLFYRVLGLLFVLAIVCLILLSTQVGRSIWSFILLSKQEVKKVVWPTREETTRTTLLVFAMVSIVGLFLWLLDMCLFWGIRFLTDQGG